MLLFHSEARCENPFDYVKDLNVEFFFGTNSGSSFYDNVNNNIIYQYDSAITDSVRNYLFEKVTYTFGLRGYYKLTDDLILTAEIPVIYSKLTETFEKDSYGNEVKRAELSLTQPLYYSVGGIYRLLDGKFYTLGSLELRIPPAFYNGVNSNPDYDYLSDGAFESLLGVRFGYNFEKSWLEANVVYNYRDEELVDQVKTRIEGGLRTVKDTYIKGYMDYVFSTKSMKDAEPFNLRTIPLQEEALSIGASLYILITESVYSSFDVSAKMYGTNSWLGGNYLLNVGVRL